jgi:hypothetical protein
MVTVVGVSDPLKVSQSIGGLVGGNIGIVSKCYSAGSVVGDVNIGGLVGCNYWSDSSISNCYFTGSVSGNQTIGGIVGANERGFLLNCFSTGDVNGVSSIGGLAGGNSWGNVSNCYSTGDVNGVSSVGGLMGYNYRSVSNCFWDTDTQTHGVTESIGDNQGTITNVVGLPTEQMKTKNTFIEAGWDFIDEYANGTSETWQMPVGGGYPSLSTFHRLCPNRS